MKKVFLLGSGIAESISPFIQNSAFRELGLDFEYGLLDVPDFNLGMNEVVADADVIGFNVTIPFKEMIFPLMTFLKPEAKAVGAVNVVNFTQERKMIGHNTDIDGIAASLSKLGLLGRIRTRAVILGAGGAARACVYSLLDNGFESVRILNRTRDKATEVARAFKLQFPDKKMEALELSKDSVANSISDRIDLLVNTIPGYADVPIEIDFSFAQKDMKYFDLNYRQVSPILRSARKQGLVTIDGLLMLVEQAAKSFEIWTGIDAPRKTMMSTALKCVNS